MEKDKIKKIVEESGSIVLFAGTIDERIEELEKEINSLKESKQENKTHTVLINDCVGLSIKLDGDKDLMKYKYYIENPIYLHFKDYVRVMKKRYWNYVASDMNNNKNLLWTHFQEKYGVSAPLMIYNLKDTCYIKRRDY